MKEIRLLEQDTIDKIAAGEVIERPSSIVKELVENAIDAGSNAVTVEIRDGGISFIRVTDNGEGIPKEQVQTAFLRHATSKIRSVEDLLEVGSLGFRGEALSSIAAVCQVELITKTAGSLTGVRYLIEGGKEKGAEEIGAPEGSTFLVRNLFYNTPARKKFLKSPTTEAGYVSDLLEHLALSHPEISFQFVSNGQTKLHTSGNCNLKDIIYSIYGREIAANLVSVKGEADGIRLSGYIGKPLISRGNRKCENCFVNGRYVRVGLLSDAIEEGYQSFLMQHRYPFTALSLHLDGSLLDVNVHPSKMELRFSDGSCVYQLVSETVRSALSSQELIPEVAPGAEDTKKAEEAGSAQFFLGDTPEPSEKPSSRSEKRSYPEPFESARRSRQAESASQNLSGGQENAPDKEPSFAEEPQADPEVSSPKRKTDPFRAAELDGYRAAQRELERNFPSGEEESTASLASSGKKSSAQMELFDDRLLSEENTAQHRLIGQVFDTYWIVQFRDNLYIIDQHAAHEKVLYERLCKSLETKEFTTQQLSPPIILTLSMQEEDLFSRYQEVFREVGFEIEPFGGREYAISGVPDNLFGFTDKDLFVEMLDSLSDTTGKPTAELLNEKLATMACKSAVKGNHRMSVSEANALIQELLGLKNPYNCPHGRPTIISMSRYELEKKFKRIV